MRLGEGGYVPSLVWEKNPLKKTPVVAPSPNPSPNPSFSLPSLPSHFPAAYLSTRHKHICKSIRGQAGPHGGARMLRIQAVQCKTCVESRGARMGGREERRRSCHYSGGESSATLCPCPTLATRERVSVAIRVDVSRMSLERPAGRWEGAEATEGGRMGVEFVPSLSAAMAADYSWETENPPRDWNLSQVCHTACGTDRG